MNNPNHRSIQVRSKPEEHLSGAIPESGDHQLLGADRVQAFDAHQGIACHERDGSRSDGWMFEWFSSSGIFPDDDFALSVPAADADVTANEAHADAMTAGANLLAAEL